MGLNNIKINNTTNVKTGVVYDISEANDGATYTDLTDALGTNGGVPAEFRESGMSIKFIQTSDNKYVQYRLISNSWSVNPYFWESYNDVTTSNQQDSDLDISDEQGNVLMRLTNGHIQVKNFSSIDALDYIQAILSNIGFDNIPEFSEEEDYAIGDIIKYEKYVYVFTSNHTAGEWDETEVEKTVVYNNPVEVADDNKADLDISDENGNVLVRFANGHIKVKNFDSADNNESISAILQNIGIDDIPVFDEEEDYEIGVIVRYNKLIYKFISVHEAGEWNSSDVEETNIIDELDVEHPVAVETILSDADLDISDENGNVLARFSGGGIKTKNFDSTKVLTKNTQGKIISILGDSISSFRGWLPSDKQGYSGATYATYYPTGTITSVEQMWWKKVINELNLTLGANCSWSGSRLIGDATSTTSAECAASNKRIVDLGQNGTPDIIVCYIGINDLQTIYNAEIGNYTTKDAWLQDINPTTLSEAYGLMLSKILKTYPLAKVFCCTLFANKATARDPDQLYPTVNGNGLYLEDVNDMIRNFTRAYGAHLIELCNCGIHWGSIALTTVDGVTHPNEVGQTLMAKMIKNSILNVY